jgi:hypothetical protein
MGLTPFSNKPTAAINPAAPAPITATLSIIDSSPHFLLIMLPLQSQVKASS